jgi:hypothetical protein
VSLRLSSISEPLTHGTVRVVPRRLLYTSKMDGAMESGQDLILAPSIHDVILNVYPHSERIVRDYVICERFDYYKWTENENRMSLFDVID